jgi:hypothetical protein
VVRRVNKLAGNDDDYADNDCTESGAGATAAPVAKKRAVVSKKK